jgi:uncharacterized damage-inducible protein DinB
MAPNTEPDRALLLDHLSSQRRHILGILEGLTDDQLHQPVLPSGWSCLGLVHHLALDVERFWFRQVMAGVPELPDGPTGLADLENAWLVGPEANATAVLDTYRREVELADAVIGTLSLEDEPAWWPDFFGDWRADNLRDVLLHVITETATHAGHLDAARERVDGRQWMVLT